ncbi:MAG TPA: molybdate ABC transporter substrate-binding protein [Gemmatimonadales bacterium]|nr:molybdate ABC transporter substrate-binding protein [Gemmatimonadales bacterium]
MITLRAAAPAAAQEARSLTVFAAASLSGAFRDLVGAFARRHPGIDVRLNFAGSQQLAVQLEHGAKADLFASADERWMRYLADRGLLAAPPRLFARNRMVVIVPAARTGGVRGLADLARPGVKLVLAAEAVPAGRYSREVLARLEAAADFPNGFARKALANVVSEEENVRAVVAKVQLGEADAGMVYASDARGGAAAGLTVLAIPEDLNVLASYPVAPLRASPAAEAFLRLLLEAEGRSILERHGFIPVPVAPADAKPEAADAP